MSPGSGGEEGGRWVSVYPLLTLDTLSFSYLILDIPLIML